MARADAYIYWADNHEGEGTTIGRENLDGTGVDANFITGLKDPCGVAVDAQHIYWANRGTTNSIGRANLDGTSVDTDFITVGAPSVGPCGPAVDDTDIWWANYGGGSGSIGRANLDGTGVLSPYISGGSVSSPNSVALNSQFAYWTNIGTSGGGSIYRQDLAGLPPQPVSLSPGPSPFWVAVNASRLFWSYTSGIRSTDLEGNDVDDLVASSASGGVALLGAKIYWADNAVGTVSRANLDGSSPELAFLQSIGHPVGLAVDAAAPPPANDFTIGTLKRNKRKGTAKLTVELPGAGALALAGKGLKTATEQADGAGDAELPIKAKGAKKRKLKHRGKLKLDVQVTFTPTGGAPNTEATKVKLVKKS